MSWDSRIRETWARTRLRVWAEPCYVASLPLESLAAAGAWVGGCGRGFAALVVERDEVSVTLPESAWLGSPLRARALAAAGPFRALTFDLDLDLELVGFLAPAAERLAEAGVSILPQCAYLKDHLLVKEEKLEDAVRAIEALIREMGDAEDDRSR
jgi:hypothetical protein